MSWKQMQKLATPKPLVFFVCVTVAGVSAEVIAAEWSNGLGISVGQAYSDNVNLDSQNEESDSSLVVTPSFSIVGKGARASVDVDASLQFSDAGGDADNFNPNLDAAAGIEALENFLFLELDASARQSLIDPFASAGRSGFNDNRNSTTTYQYSASPYIASRIKDYASYELRYTRDNQLNDGDDLDDSTEDSASFDLMSGRYFRRLSWGWSTNYSSTDYDDDMGNVSVSDGSDNEFLSSSLRFGYRLDRKWQLNASVGKEWNDYVSRDDDVDGDSWSVGVAWTPNKRTKVNLGYGDRYFGDAPLLDISYRHKRSELQLGYSKTVTDTRGIRQQEGLLVSSNPGGGLNRYSSLTSGDNNTIVDERLDFSLSFKGQRTQLTLEGDHSKQTREDTGIEDRFSGYSFSTGRILRSNLSIDFTYSWDEREEGDNGNVVVTDDYVLSVTRNLGAHTSLIFSYSLTDRDSDDVGDYTENRVSLYLTSTY